MAQTRSRATGKETKPETFHSQELTQIENRMEFPVWMRVIRAVIPKEERQKADLIKNLKTMKLSYLSELPWTLQDLRMLQEFLGRPIFDKFKEHSGQTQQSGRQVMLQKPFMCPEPDQISWRGETTGPVPISQETCAVRKDGRWSSAAMQG